MTTLSHSRERNEPWLSKENRAIGLYPMGIPAVLMILGLAGLQTLNISLPNNFNPNTFPNGIPVHQGDQINLKMFDFKKLKEIREAPTCKPVTADQTCA